MKRITAYIIIFASLGLFSCEEDPLKLLPPNGLVKEDYWKTKEDVKATLIGAYQEFAKMDQDLFYYGELRGDLLEEGMVLSNNLRDVMNSNIYPWNPLTRWQNFYQVINYCNSVLKYSEQVKESDNTFTEYRYNAYNAEAVFLRSLAYFYMVRVFKDVPFILFPYDSDKQDFFPAKTDGGVILDSLESQLNRITTSIPETYETNELSRGRATRGAVYALLADIALWQFDYENCISYIEKVEEIDLYEMVEGAEWFTIFSEGNTTEGIFEFQFDSRLGQNNSLYGITRPESNNFRASQYALEILDPEVSLEIVRGNGTIYAQNRVIWKYIGAKPDAISERSGADQRSANWIVYRLADIKLMKAEALSQLGRYDEALTLVNEIRSRAFMEAYSSWPRTPQDFEDLIYEERAKELAYEGKRWFDLLRMGRRNNYARKDKLIEFIIENVPATQKRILASKLRDPNGWYMPINNNEVENNPNLVQNPYYQIFQDED